MAAASPADAISEPATSEHEALIEYDSISEPATSESALIEHVLPPAPGVPEHHAELAAAA